MLKYKLSFQLKEDLNYSLFVKIFKHKKWVLLRQFLKKKQIKKIVKFKRFFKTNLQLQQKVKLYGRFKTYQFKTILNVLKKKNKKSNCLFSSLLFMFFNKRLETLLFNIFKNYYKITQIRQWILFGDVYVNSQKVTSPSFLLQLGSIVTFSRELQFKIKTHCLTNLFIHKINIQQKGFVFHMSGVEVNFNILYIMIVSSNLVSSELSRVNVNTLSRIFK